MYCVFNVYVGTTSKYNTESKISSRFPYPNAFDFFSKNLSRLLNTFDEYAYLIRRSFSHGDLMCLPHCTHKSKLKP